jgi:hypothetical protein
MLDMKSSTSLNLRSVHRERQDVYDGEKDSIIQDGLVKNLAQADTRHKKNYEQIHQGEGVAANEPGKPDNAQRDKSEVSR